MGVILLNRPGKSREIPSRLNLPVVSSPYNFWCRQQLCQARHRQLAKDTTGGLPVSNTFRQLSSLLSVWVSVTLKGKGCVGRLLLGVSIDGKKACKEDNGGIFEHLNKFNAKEGQKRTKFSERCDGNNALTSY